MLAGFAQSIYHVQISHSRKASIDITIAGTVSPDSSHWNDQVSRGKAGADGAGSADADGGFHPNVAQLVDTDFCTGSTDASGDTANFSTLISATGGAELSVIFQTGSLLQHVEYQVNPLRRAGKQHTFGHIAGMELNVIFLRFGAGKFGFQMRHSINTPCSQCPL